MNRDNTSPLTDALRTAMDQEAQATNLLLEQVTQQAKSDGAYKQLLAKEPEKAVQEAVQKLPEEQRRAIGDQQVEKVAARVADLANALSSVLPEIDVDQVQQLVFGTIEDARRSFRLSLWLTQFLFYVGLAMVVGAFITAIVVDPRSVAALIFGAAGVSGVITSLVLNPLDRVQNAAGNLVQLEIAFLSYYKILYTLHRPPGELGHKEAVAISREIRTITDDVLSAIDRHIERRGTEKPASGGAGE